MPKGKEKNRIADEERKKRAETQQQKDEAAYQAKQEPPVAADVEAQPASSKSPKASPQSSPRLVQFRDTIDIIPVQLSALRGSRGPRSPGGSVPESTPEMPGSAGSIGSSSACSSEWVPTPRSEASDPVPRARRNSEGEQKIAKFAVGVVFPLGFSLAAVVFLMVFISIGPAASLQWLLGMVPKSPQPWHAFILGLAITVCIVFLIPLWPALMIVTSVVFDFWLGCGIGYCAVFLGALISFALGRSFEKPVREFFETRDYSRVRRMMHVMEDESDTLKFMLLFRFLFIPIWIRNYVPALLQVPLSTFLIPVSVHSAFVCFMYSMVGATTKDVAEIVVQSRNVDTIDPARIAWLAVSVVALALLSYLAHGEFSKRLGEEDVKALDF